MSTLAELSRVPLRTDLTEAYEAAWRHIAAPGTWLDGKTRLAIAAETRNALSCALCRERAAALSPFVGVRSVG